jgi:hypothetical protein
MHRSPRLARLLTTASLLALLIPVAGHAQDDRFDFGVRFNALAGDGEPSNDMLGAGIYGHYRLNKNWLVGAGLDFSDFDFERPHKIIGITPVATTDADASSTTVSVWIERRYDRPGKRFGWFWTAGAGFSSVDVDDITGPTAGGGTFNITTDADTETLLLGSVGLRYRFAQKWTWQGALRIEQHFADWKVFDRVSGRVDTVDDYTVKGLHFGVERSF